MAEHNNDPVVVTPQVPAKEYPQHDTQLAFARLSSTSIVHASQYPDSKVASPTPPQAPAVTAGDTLGAGMSQTAAAVEQHPSNKDKPKGITPQPNVDNTQQAVTKSEENGSPVSPNPELTNTHTAVPQPKHIAEPRR